MKTNQHTPDQIIKILDQAANGDQTVAAVCREHGIAEHTFYRWRKTYAGMSVSEVQRLKELEKENSRLKRLLAERMRENDLLKEFLKKRANAGRPTRRRRVLRRGWTVGAPCLRRRAAPSVDMSLHGARTR